MDLPKQVAVNSADGYLAACEAGYGLVQTPYYHVMQQLQAGSLVEVLGAIKPPQLALTALYPPHRQLSPRVRVLVDWLVELCARPGQVLLMMRMRHACQLFKQDQTVADVALAVGYQSVAAFTRAFYKVTGQQPGAYRKAQA